MSLLSPEFLKTYHLSENKLKENYGLTSEEVEDINSSWSGYDLLHGECVFVSRVLWLTFYRLGIPASDMRTERAQLTESEGSILHEYLVIDRGGVPYYADIRGVTSDYKEFMQEFVDWEKDTFAMQIDINALRRVTGVPYGVLAKDVVRDMEESTDTYPELNLAEDLVHQLLGDKQILDMFVKDLNNLTEKEL